ncbi:P-loop containing nucleoside triphosphate hydrolase protein [Lanmaoa asiatica]|nr:P-loop containing nucleoside triphosphate hydrolase protein [Lanmaoa asiatica]
MTIRSTTVDRNDYLTQNSLFPRMHVDPGELLRIHAFSSRDSTAENASISSTHRCLSKDPTLNPRRRDLTPSAHGTLMMNVPWARAHCSVYPPPFHRSFSQIFIPPRSNTYLVPILAVVQLSTLSRLVRTSMTDKWILIQMSPPPDFIMASVNIVLFGETGVGKSSVINLIAGQQIAIVSPDTMRCTLSSRRYSFPVSGKVFHIWDTPGLEEPEMGAVGYMAAIEGALTLIQQLAQQGGIDLLLFCMRGNRVTATTQSNYRLFHGVLCRSQVPIALVITHLEREPDMEAWWTRNLASMEKYGIKSAGHACVTALPTHGKYPQSRANVERMLRGYNGQGKYVMPADSWFIEFLRVFGFFAPPKKELKKKKLLTLLTKRCKLNSKIAEELAEKLVRA